MDGLLLAYLIGIYGFPAPPPMLEPLALMVLPDPGHLAQRVNQPGPTGTSAASDHTALPPLIERPVVPSQQSDIQANPDQSGAGKLPRTAITLVVGRKSEAIRHCYELGLTKDEHFAGTVEIGWKIQMDGRVSSVNIVGTTKSNDAVEECLLAEIMRWEFPPSAEPTVVGVYPFVFDPSLLIRRTGQHKTTTAP